MAEPMMASIMGFGGSYAPRQWHLCDGQLLSVAEFSALFSVLGDRFGGDGRTTFGLPDLRGRSILGAGSATGRTPRVVGQAGGYEAVTLSTAQMPSHTHTIQSSVSGEVHVTATAKCRDANANSGMAGGAVLANQQSGGGASVYTNQSPNETMNPGFIEASATNDLVVQSVASNTGGSQGHSNMHPFQCIEYIIALDGYYPSRN